MLRKEAIKLLKSMMDIYKERWELEEFKAYVNSLKNNEKLKSDLWNYFSEFLSDLEESINILSDLDDCVDNLSTDKKQQEDDEEELKVEKIFNKIKEMFVSYNWNLVIYDKSDTDWFTKFLFSLEEDAVILDKIKNENFNKMFSDEIDFDKINITSWRLTSKRVSELVKWAKFFAVLKEENLDDLEDLKFKFKLIVNSEEDEDALNLNVARLALLKSWKTSIETSWITIEKADEKSNGKIYLVTMS